MSDIPKSKRAYSNLEAHHKALEIRRKIAVELLASFAYSEKKLEEAVRKQTQHIRGPKHRAGLYHRRLQAGSGQQVPDQ